MDGNDSLGYGDAMQTQPPAQGDVMPDLPSPPHTHAHTLRVRLGHSGNTAESTSPYMLPLKRYAINDVSCNSSEHSGDTAEGKFALHVAT